MRKFASARMAAALVFALALTGCGGKDPAESKEEGTAVQGTEDHLAADRTGFDETGDSEGSSQLRLGTAVEIPAGFQGELAETGAHGKLERAIAEYCGISEKDYARVRYYYNYVDLNEDGKNEILALTLGQEVPGINGNVLLWLDSEDDVGAHTVRQAFYQTGVPVYISNHRTEGYKDLILAIGKDVAAGKSVEASNAGRTADGDATSLQRTAGLDETTGDNGAALISMDQSYMLLTFQGGKYQEMEEGTALFSLEGYEGTAILTNNIESDLVNDNYHILGEAMR